MTPLPRGRTTNHFGVLMDTIWNTVEKKSAHVADSIMLELRKNTPVRTGTLKANWFSGGFPTMKRIPYPGASGSVVIPPFKAVSRKGRNITYYIWNNAQNTNGVNYLEYVNAGIVSKGQPGTKAKSNIGFVQKSIAAGELKASKGLL